jgi:hypothetical protein
VTTDPTSALTTAYWDNFLTVSSSSLGRDWDRLDQVEEIIRGGGRSATDLVVDLIETAPRDRDGWLSYLLSGPIEDLWNRSEVDQLALVEASSRSADLAEALAHLDAPSTPEPGRAARKTKRPSKRQGNRPNHP